MACEQVFLERLRESGLRLTPQREMVLSVLHHLEGVATAEEIHTKVRALSSAVDISTVYRTLDLLKELDLVACIDPADQQHRYELLGVHGPHLHLVCRSCGKVIGVSLSEAESLTSHLRTAHGFEAQLGEVTVPGLCRECQTANERAVDCSAVLPDGIEDE
jgi:Fur family ferric uptake transcriptional regulator